MGKRKLLIYLIGRQSKNHDKATGSNAKATCMPKKNGHHNLSHKFIFAITIPLLNNVTSLFSSSSQPQWTLLSLLPGAYDLPKAAKKHETYATCQVPSQSKFIEINRQLLLNSFHIWKVLLPRY